MWSRSSIFSHRDICASTTSTCTSSTIDETTALLLPHERGPHFESQEQRQQQHTSSAASTAPLPHERGPDLESQGPSRQQRTSSAALAALNAILMLHPQDVGTANRMRLARLLREGGTETSEVTEEVEEEQQGQPRIQAHVLSRIDTIEIGLWQTRLREVEEADAALLSLSGAQEADSVVSGAGVEAQDFGERLSRQSTYVNDSGEPNGQGQGPRKRKWSAASAYSLATSTHFHPWFWVDVAGIAVLSILIFGMIGYVVWEAWRGGRQRSGGGGKEICGLEGGIFWVTVQMLVAVVLGLGLQVPVSRWIVPFVLPAWLAGTCGVVLAIRWTVCGRLV